MKHLRPPDLPTTKPEDRLRAPPIVLMLFGIIVCLVVANLIFRFPDLGLTVEQFNPFAGP